MGPLSDGLPAHLGLLLLCARTRVGEAEARQIRELLARGVDWTTLVRSALHHHVAPLVARALETTAPDLVPSDVLAAFGAYARRNRADNERFTDELLALMQSLDARGVAAVPFKGPLLAELAYGDRGLRNFQDLDFLIDAEDLPATLEVLRSHDYDVDAPFTATQLRGMRRAWGQDCFVRRDGQVIVEPHWAFLPDKMAVAIDYPALRARCRPAKLKGVAIRSFALEDVALILSVHGAKELWWRLAWVCDVAELIGAHPALDWKVALDRAQRQGGRRMLLLAVTLAERLLGCAVPSPLVPALARDGAVTRLAKEAMARLLAERTDGAPTFDAVAAFRRRAHDGWRAQVTYVVRTLVRPGPAHYEMIALPRRLAFGYYVVKAVHDYAVLPIWQLGGRLRGRRNSTGGGDGEVPPHR